MNSVSSVALFIPCYVDWFFPDVGIATVDVLEGLGLEVVFPEAQSCCGQPFANLGCREDARPLVGRFLDTFEAYDCVVAPSASCIAMVRRHALECLEPGVSAERFAALAARCFELTEFLRDRFPGAVIGARFPHRVALHESCHGLRELGLGSPSERSAGGEPSTAREWLGRVADLELVEPARPDECCGFGGSFAAFEPEVSTAMGRDRVEACEAVGAEIVTATDVSCLMQIEGVARRRGSALRAMHVAQILAGRPLGELG